MIAIKNALQQDGIRRSAELLSRVFSRIEDVVAPGCSSFDVERTAIECIRNGGGIPAFLNYGGFPSSICASVNDRVIHGIPDKQPLKDGDIVGFDIGVLLNGYYSDACKTFAVGEVSESTRNLLQVTRKSLEKAIDVCYPGNRVKDIGKAISKEVEPYGYGIVYSYCGHGVGLSLHEDPQIPNYYPSRCSNPRLQPGMVLAIEPMVNAGKPDVEVLDDGWTVLTCDRSLSAHFEHSVLITPSGPQRLTYWT